MCKTHKVICGPDYITLKGTLAFIFSNFLISHIFVFLSGSFITLNVSVIIVTAFSNLI